MLKDLKQDSKIWMNCSPLACRSRFGFTLAEVLIVIGIIGVVAALTLPNLNHATGDKETVTRLLKLVSTINEANDRAEAIYGPISSWSENCKDNLHVCWSNRISEFLKITNQCNELVNSGSDEYKNCDSLKGGFIDNRIISQFADGSTFSTISDTDCSYTINNSKYKYDDICFDEFHIDVNGPNKGKNEFGKDIFAFALSDSIGLVPYYSEYCMQDKDERCTWWVLEYGNLDYLKADESGKCNDSNIILDGTTNTSCH